MKKTEGRKSRATVPLMSKYEISQSRIMVDTVGYGSDFGSGSDAKDGNLKPNLPPVLRIQLRDQSRKESDL
jgi:hypothetical protein